MKRMLVFILMFTFVMQSVSLTVVTGKVHAEVCPDWEYDTDGSTIVIDSTLELSCIREKLDGVYKLTEDIDLEGYDYDGDGKGWMPIGNSTARFTGTLDGNGYAIRNMTINRPVDSRIGLFGHIDGTNAKLINIRLLDINVTGESVLGGATVGGLAGLLAEGTIENSYATGRVSVSGPDSIAGGLVGVNASGTIQNSYAVVHVVGAERVGGLVGMNADTIQNSYAAGNVKGSKDIGGLVGYNTPSGTIQDSYAVGVVSGNTGVGGLVGRDDAGSGTTTGSYWNKETTDQLSGVSGTGITTEEMKDPNTFPDDWDDAGWGFRDGETYPYLRAFHMGIGVEPLAAATYNLGHGQDALSVRGNVYHEASGEPITVKYVFHDSSNVTVTEATYNINSDDNSTLSINRRFSLAGWSDDNYTLTITAADTRNTVVGAMLAFTVDSDAASPPSVSIETNGSESWAQSASTTVIVIDSGGGVNEDSLQYAWSSDTVTPFSGWTPFTDEQILSKSGTDGDWYLHIQVEDDSGNPANVVSDRFRLDNAVPTISITQAPGSDELTSGLVTVMVESDGTGSEIAETRWADGVRSEAYFSSGGTLFTGDSFQVATNGAYAVYAEDQAGNGTVETVYIDNIISELPQIGLTYSPTTVTNGSVVIMVTADVYEGVNSLTKLNWMPGSHSAVDFSGGTAGNDILNEKKFTVTTNGTYTVYAKDAAGNEAVEKIEITNIVTTEPDDDDDDSGRSNWPNRPNPSSAPAIIEAPNGGIMLVIDSSSIVKERLADGTVIEKVVLTDEIIEQVLDSLETADKPFVTIAINDSEQAVQVQFPASSLGKTRGIYPEAVFEVMLNGSSFQLQIDVLNLEELAEQLGVDLQLMKVNVVIEQVAGQVEEQLIQIAGNQGLKVIGQAVEYQVTVSAGEQTIEIQDFGGTYIVRAIVLDDSLSGNHLIAVLYEPAEQTLSFVPAVLATRNEGRQEMSMNVPHNSIYAIMEAANKSFTDLNGHWAKGDVELMASKLIVNGVSDTRFAPDISITRAEFAALLVRALGIKMEDKIEYATFRDVSGDDWYAPAIEAGINAGLVDGIANNRFAPNSEITREQMAVMISNALSVVGKSELDPGRVSNILERFSDQSDISVWARSAVAQSVEAGIIDGITEDTMAPVEHATRAQAAVMLKRFLQYIKFMD